MKQNGRIDESNPDSEIDSEIESEIQRLDATEELITEKRLETITELRRDIHNIRRDVKLGNKLKSQYREKYGTNKRITVYRTVVDSWIMELEPLMRQYDFGEQFLYHRDYGDIVIEPPIKYDNQTGHRVIHTKEHGKELVARPDSMSEPEALERTLEPRHVSVEGLTALFQLDDPIVEQFHVPTSKLANVRQVPVKGQVPADKLDLMVRDMNHFLAKVGLEMKPEAEREPHQI
jgi:hypothetical protein